MTISSAKGEPSAAILEKILDCQGSESFAIDMLVPLTESLGAASGVFIEMFDRPGGGLQFGARDHIGIASHAVESYIEDYYVSDPVIQPLLRWMDTGNIPPAAIATESFGRRGRVDIDPRYASSFLQPWDIGHVIAFSFPLKIGLEKKVALLGFHRGHSAPEFDLDQVSWLRRVAPAIRSVFYARAHEEALSLAEASAIAVREAGAAKGIVILDEDLVVRNGNTRGLKDLGLSGANGPSVLLGRIKQQLLDGAAGRRAELDLRIEDGPGLKIEVRTIVSCDDRLFYLIITGGTSVRADISHEWRQFGLTEREMDVVRQLASGKCNASLSHALEISLRTTENHLRSIYRKVGVNSRTQLVSRLFRLH